MSASRRSFLRAGACALLPATLPGHAAAYPERPLQLVVAYTAGSANDIIGRLIGAALASQLHQPVVVENRPGAGGSLGTAHVARAQPDGYKLLVMSNGTLAINPVVLPGVGYDPRKDFVPVGLVGSTPNLLVVAADSPYRHTRDLIAAARLAARPLQYTSGGVATTQHLLGVLLASKTGVAFDHVPYQGPSEGLLGLLRGEGAFGFATLPSALALARSGKLRVLGSSSAVDEAVLAGVQTLGSQGFADFDNADIWFNVAAPQATPADAVRTLHAAFAAFGRNAEFVSGLRQKGYAPAPALSGAPLQAFVEGQIDFWSGLARAAGLAIG
ncbi:MAG TPA: tripartite tricarboxylate transporter substrate binding protein [Pseudorhodoferax sp.]|jgi:tripartite-type tricarboxylate transporter receptor subunit TctC|nr:tripartite tricarboxylate transporter substrate binding protein [Pseudorhodoferax sp.]